MSMTARDVFARDVRILPPDERLRLAALILDDLTTAGTVVVAQSDAWTEEDQRDLTTFSLEHASRLYPEEEELV